MTEAVCPKCHALHTRRVKQNGLFQKVVLQRLGYFPWECRFCKATFVLKNRGHRISDDKRIRQQPRPKQHREYGRAGESTLALESTGTDLNTRP